MGDCPRQSLRGLLPSVAVCRPLPLQSGRPSLRLLAERILGISVQQVEHCSVSVAWGDAPQDRGPALTLQPRRPVRGLDDFFLGGRWPITIRWQNDSQSAHYILSVYV